MEELMSMFGGGGGGGSSSPSLTVTPTATATSGSSLYGGTTSSSGDDTSILSGMNIGAAGIIVLAIVVLFSLFIIFRK